MEWSFQVGPHPRLSVAIFAAEGRDNSVRAVVRETDLALGTVQRVATGNSGELAGVKLGTIETLSNYFGVPVGGLIEVRKD